MRRTLPIVMLGVVLAALAVSLAAAQSGGYEAAWYAVSGGGGASTGGDGYAVAGSIGQAAPGQASGGGQVVAGGFWALPAATQAAPTQPPASNDYVVLLPFVQR